MARRRAQGNVTEPLSQPRRMPGSEQPFDELIAFTYPSIRNLEREGYRFEGIEMTRQLADMTLGSQVELVGREAFSVMS